MRSDECCWGVCIIQKKKKKKKPLPKADHGDSLCSTSPPMNRHSTQNLGTHPATFLGPTLHWLVAARSGAKKKNAMEEIKNLNSVRLADGAPVEACVTDTDDKVVPPALPFIHGGAADIIRQPRRPERGCVG